MCHICPQIASRHSGRQLRLKNKQFVACKCDEIYETLFEPVFRRWEFFYGIFYLKWPCFLEKNKPLREFNSNKVCKCWTLEQKSRVGNAYATVVQTLAYAKNKRRPTISYTFIHLSYNNLFGFKIRKFYFLLKKIPFFL